MADTTTPVLKAAPASDFRKRWTIPSQPHLRVEAEYDEERGRVASLRGYSVVDTRHHVHDRRHLVRFFTHLADVRDWIRDGTPAAGPTS
jgi:hypothetical protein